MGFFNPNAGRGAAFFAPRAFAGGGRFFVQNNNFFNMQVINRFNQCPPGGYFRCPGEFRRECFERSFRPGWQFALGATIGGALNALAASQNPGYYQPAVYPGYTPPYVAQSQMYQPPAVNLSAEANQHYQGFRMRAAQANNLMLVQALDALVSDPSFQALGDPAAQTEAMRLLVDAPYATNGLIRALTTAAARSALPNVAIALRNPDFQQMLRQQGPEFAMASVPAGPLPNPNA
jgi:hypothetical protein